MVVLVTMVALVVPVASMFSFHFVNGYVTMATFVCVRTVLIYK